MAAYWLVSPPSPRGALASPPHQPYEAYWAIVSTKPWLASSSRGGQVGSRVKPMSPMRVEIISQVRSLRYAAGRRLKTQTSSAGVSR